MTAEVAVLNKYGIALAADTLITVTGKSWDESDQEIREHVANSTHGRKLYKLSNEHTVAAMTNGTRELLGVPWALIIGRYRQNLGNKSFKTIREYATDFIQFVSQSALLFPAERQMAFFNEATKTAFARIVLTVESQLKGTSEPSDEARRDRTEKVIDEEHARLMAMPLLEHKLQEQLEFDAIINQKRNDAFNEVPLSENALLQLTQIAWAQVNRGAVVGSTGNPFGSTGVVIAGFGDDELFPHVFTFYTHSVCQNQLLWCEAKQLSYPDFDERTVAVGKAYARIIPFGQRETVDTVIHGMSSAILQATLNDLCEKVPAIVADVATELNNPDLLSLTGCFKKKFQEYVASFAADCELQNRRTSADAIKFLTLEELAELASVFVETTSLKHRIQPAPPTVGGHVDVAMISKDNGFVWVSRNRDGAP